MDCLENAYETDMMIINLVQILIHPSILAVWQTNRAGCYQS